MNACVYSGLIFSIVNLLHCKYVYSNTETCLPLTAPDHGVISRCRNGTNHLSVCTTECEPGYELVGGSRTLCWCGGGNCDWRGIRPICEATDCDVPDYDIGRVFLVDQWPGGFAAVMELNDVQEIVANFEAGWSLVLIFDRPLGTNATVSSWNAQTISKSFDGQTFTLLNAEHNFDLAKSLTTGDIGWLFVAEHVNQDVPEAAYIGLYNRRIRDATCFKAPKMTKIEAFGVIREQKKEVGQMTSTTGETTTEVGAVKNNTVTTTVSQTTSIITTTQRSPTTPKSVTRRVPLRRRRKPTKSPTTINPLTTPETIASSTFLTSQSTIIDIQESTASTTYNTVEEEIIVSKFGERYCILQAKENSYKTQDGWEDDGVPFFSGNAVLTVDEHLLDWAMLMVFDVPIAEVQVWSCSVIDHSEDGRMWTFGPNSWNMDLYPGESDINFIAKQTEKSQSVPSAKAYLCSYAFTEGDTIAISSNSQLEQNVENEEIEQAEEEVESQEEEEEIIVKDSKVEKPKGTPTMWKRPKRISRRCRPSSPNGTAPKYARQTVLNFKYNNDGTKYNYNELLHKSILFYEAQRSGVLPSTNRIPWRGNSALKDGCDIGVDLSGGWFDAGDHVKFHFPMSFSAVMLAWGGLMFQDAYKDANEFESLKDSIRWPVSYLMKAHISKFEFVGQIGIGKADHSFAGRAEEMNMDRPSFVLSPEKPGSEVTAEAAAALAATSILFRDSHKLFSKNTLRHAKELFEFADQYRGDYHDSIPDVKDFYFSYSGYNDELIWAAAWLYKATNDKEYLMKAKGLYVKLGGQYIVESEFSWERKLIGAQILLANLTGEDIYRKPVEGFLENLLKAKTNSQGLFWLRKWGPNRYAANMAFAVLAASTLHPPFPKMQVYLEWAEKQIHLLLGDAGRSFVVGFGKNYPQRVHHRSSACLPFPALCNLQTFSSSKPNYFILYGALVGGPDERGVFLDNRNVYEQTEVSCDYNAGFQGAIAGLKHKAMKKRKQNDLG